jgi:hypothetical protein
LFTTQIDIITVLGILSRQRASQKDMLTAPNIPWDMLVLLLCGLVVWEDRVRCSLSRCKHFLSILPVFIYKLRIMVKDIIIQANE